MASPNASQGLPFRSRSQRQGLHPQPNPLSSETDEASTPGLLTRQVSSDSGDRQNTLPTLSHRLRHSSSILAIALSDEEIYAGTQAGEILVYGLNTYERKAVIEGHRGSVLGLCLARDEGLLFSSAGDRIVNVWSTRDWSRKCCLFSSYDVGDIFCVVYSSALQTIYLGAQNTSIQWCNQAQKGTPKCPRRNIHPSLRDDPFFDSAGPGGIRTPRPAEADITPRHAKGGELLEIGKENVRHFAHYGYVYCMLLVKDGVPESAGNEVLITGGGDGVIKLWKLSRAQEGAPEELFALDDGREEGHSIHSIALDGTFLYSSRSGGEIDVWDLETRQLIRNLKAHRDDVLTLTVGGGFMFSAAVTGYVRKFDRQYTLKSRLKAHEGRILASAFTTSSSSGRPIYVTGGSDHTLAVWDITDCSLTTKPAQKQTSNEKLFEALRRFVSYRTISSSPSHSLDCRRGASYLRSVLKNFGAQTEMLPTEDRYNPVILARFRGNPATRDQRKKILFYGHYDVVAAEEGAGKWMNGDGDPFTMEGIDGYCYGRGTSDNKGPIMAAVFACAELVEAKALEGDVIFLIEGEEECGSRGFEKAVQDANAKGLIGDVDWVLVACSYWLDDRVPCLTYGLRGVVQATVQVESGHPDLHSGVDGSRQLDEPLKDLVMLLSTLTGKGGEVMIPGFYDPIPPLGSAEKELYRDIVHALVQRNPELGDPETLATSLMRRWREASLTIHKFQTSGPDNATIIPRLAKASLSVRLVPNQEAQAVAQALTTFLQGQFAKLLSANNMTVTINHQAEPWLGDWTNEIFQTLEEAIMNAWGPIDQTAGHSALGSELKIAAPERQSTESIDGSGAQDTHGYFGGHTKRPSTATSSVLANGSLAQQPLTPLTEASHKLASLTSPTSSPEKTKHPRRSSSETSTGAPAARRKPLFIREGGSIPAIRFLEKEFDAPAAHFPVGQASDSAHLDNERLRLVNLYKGRDIFKKVFGELPLNPSARFAIELCVALEKAYKSIRGAEKNLSVEKLLLGDADLNVSRMKRLMAFSDEEQNVPLYMEVMMEDLRRMAISQRPFTVAEFEERKVAKGFKEGQASMLNMRLDLLKSFMNESHTSQEGLFKTEPGTLTIVDLADPFLDPATVCMLFDICLALFKQNRPSSGLVIRLDEAHRYLNKSTAADAFTESLVSTIRMQRHNATRVIIATQEPTISERLLDLCSISIVHHFNSPAWYTAIKDHLGGASALNTSHEKGKRMVETLWICGLVMKLGSGFVKMQTRLREGVDAGRSEMASG
ncbi:glutathione degradosome [Hortaea werneckii]|nr:glutathione degradosome [Hortaea werneckii]